MVARIDECAWLRQSLRRFEVCRQGRHDRQGHGGSNRRVRLATPIAGTIQRYAAKGATFAKDMVARIYECAWLHQSLGRFRGMPPRAPRSPRRFGRIEPTSAFGLLGVRVDDCTRSRCDSNTSDECRSAKSAKGARADRIDGRWCGFVAFSPPCPWRSWRPWRHISLTRPCVWRPWRRRHACGDHGGAPTRPCVWRPWRHPLRPDHMWRPWRLHHGDHGGQSGRLTRQIGGSGYANPNLRSALASLREKGYTSASVQHSRGVSAE